VALSVSYDKAGISTFLLLCHLPRQYINDLYRREPPRRRWQPGCEFWGGLRRSYPFPGEACLGNPHTSDHTCSQPRVKKYFAYFYNQLISTMF
jgi:hypothetical protein